MKSANGWRAQPPRSEQFVIYRVLDGLTDTFFPVLERLDDRIERLDDRDLRPGDAAPAEEITALRRRAGRAAAGRHPAARPAGPGHRRHPRNPRPGGRLTQLLPRRLRPLDPDLRPDRLLPRPARRLPRRLPLGRLQPPQPDHQAADGDGDDLPAALLRRRLLRPELQVAGDQHPVAGAFFALGIGSLVLSALALLIWFRRSDYI